MIETTEQWMRKLIDDGERDPIGRIIKANVLDNATNILRSQQR